MELDLDTVQSLIGDEYICHVLNPDNNIKISLTRLIKKNTANFTDDQKIDLLIKARHILRSAGYIANLRLSQRTGNKYTPWPHLWVNKQDVKQSSNHKKYINLVQNIAQQNQNHIDTTIEQLDVLNKIYANSTNQIPY